MLDQGKFDMGILRPIFSDSTMTMTSRDTSAMTREAHQLVEVVVPPLRVDAVGTDEQLVEVIGAQHLLRHLTLERFGMGSQVPPVISRVGSFPARAGTGHIEELVITMRPRLLPAWGSWRWWCCRCR